MKIVINKCFGGFALSKDAYKFLGLEWDRYGYAFSDDRTNPKLVECVEALGESADGEFARLKVIEIPDDVEWEIEGNMGIESVHEIHRTWD